MKTPWPGLLLLLLLAAVARGGTAPPASLDLPRCFALALEHNPELRTASTQFLAAEGQEIKLHAILYPTVNAQALTTPVIFYVQIQQTFYSAATLPRLRLSRLTREQAFLNYRQVLVDVFFQVRQAFTTALGAGAQVRLAHELVESRQSAVKAGHDLFNAGILQRGDVMPLEVLVSLAQQNESLARLTRQQAVLALAQVVGVDLPADETLTGTLEDSGPAHLDPAALAAQALQQRPDLQLLENARLSARQQIRIDLKNIYPEIGFESDSAFQPPSFLPSGAISYDIERNYNEPEVQRENGNTQLPLSLYLNWLVFDGGQLAGVRMADTAQLATQQEAIDALRRAIPGEIASAVSVIETERATLRLLGGQTPPDEVEKDAQVDYQAGRVRLLDKVNLETDIVSQRQLRLASQIRLSLAQAALDHALGRGLEAPRSPVAAN
jgi:outer membrane protein TolC